eukprot:9485559-Pyramimonas_sp.AAC.1
MCAVRCYCPCHAARQDEWKSSSQARFGSPFQAPLLPFGPFIRYVPPRESRYRGAKTGAVMPPGIYLGYVHKAVGMVGPDSFPALPRITRGSQFSK